MEKYTKKPVTIEAVQWDGKDETSQAIREWIENEYNAGAVVDTAHIQDKWDYDAGAYRMPNGHLIFAPYNQRCLIVVTLEGDMIASPEDWIIRGIEGEFYPCKPKIFADSYDRWDPEHGGYDEQFEVKVAVRKPLVAEAIQFKGGAENASSIVTWLLEECDITSSYFEGSQTTFPDCPDSERIEVRLIPALPRTWLYKDGWIVRDENGVHIYGPEQYKARYQ